jgi:hypothetical protein
MRFIATFTLLAASLTACAPEPPTAPLLRFEAPAASRVRKEFELETDMRLLSQELRHDGELVPSPEGETPPQARVESRERFVFVDEFGALSEGRPTHVVRNFEALEGLKRHTRTDEFGDHVDERAKSSVLTGRVVRFEWRAGELSRSYVGDAGDEESLAALEEDTDLRAVLPAGPVEPGSKWPVDVRVAATLLHPGGGLDLAASQDSHAARAGQAQLRANLAGELHATYWGVREREGRKFAVLELRGELRTNSETRDEQPDIAITQRFALTRQVRGEVLWDLAAHRAHSASLEAELQLDSTTLQTRKDDLAPREIERRASFAGTARSNASFSAAR